MKYLETNHMADNKRNINTFLNIAILQATFTNVNIATLIINNKMIAKKNFN